MRKRRSKSGLDDAVNMDVMMDNMTDVVGTLLFVLIIVQLKLNNTIDQIQSSLPKVTQEQLEGKRKMAAEELALYNIVETDWRKKEESQPVSPEVIQQKQAALELSGQKLKSLNVNLTDLEKLKQQAEDKKKALETESNEMAKLREERNRLKDQLGKMPIPKAEAAKVVRFPSGREVPENAQLVPVWIVNGRLYLPNNEEITNLVVQTIKPVKNSLILTKGDNHRGVDNNIYDHQKTADYLNQRKLSNQSFNFTFPIMATLDRIHVEVHPKPNGGESPAQFLSMNSAYQNLLKGLKSKPKSVVWFIVYPNSVETYYRARDACDAAGIPCGWDFHEAPALPVDILAFSVNRLAAPPTTPPAHLPHPKRTLD